MHEAYEVVPIIQKLPQGLVITSISAYDDYLLIGTRSGTLLFYQLVKNAKGSLQSSSAQYEVQLRRSNKSFQKRALTQLQVVPEFQILICLAENTVAVFDLSQGNLAILSTLPKTKGAHYFAVNVQKHVSLTGEVKSSFRLCVAIKKKLQLYYWKEKDSKFLELAADLNLRDTPKSMIWCAESLFIGYKSEYSLIKLNGEARDLFPTGGKQKDPLITQLPDERLAMGSDEQSIVIDSEGNPTMSYSIKWSEVPIGLAHDSPYLIAILPYSVEVRSIEPRFHAQTIELQKAKMIVTSHRGWVFAASESDVWLLRAVSFTEQISELLSQKQFELALCMADMTEESELKKNEWMQRIESLNAFHLFCKTNFKEAMTVFVKLKTDLFHVIGLFPKLLHEKYRTDLRYPNDPPVFQGNELENGLVALSEYLRDVRNQILVLNSTKQNISMTTIIDFATTKCRPNEELLQLIDTTLLKCYLQTNDLLVASLLRMKDNYCDIEECEKILQSQRRYSDLIILYNVKGMHRKALELLQRQAKKPDSPLKGHTKTIQYLQHLGTEHLALIFSFAKWVIKEYPEDGLKIFADDVAETENLPRTHVLNFLQGEDFSDLVIPYLEFIIDKWKDTNSIFHNALVTKYCKKTLALLKEYRNSLPEGHSPPAAGLEPGELGELRGKLLTFLQTSKHYIPTTFVSSMLNDGLYDEGAIVLGKLNRHEEALTIYAHVLNNPTKAEQYCLQKYCKGKSGDQDVYLLLLKLYLPPIEGQQFHIPGRHYSQFDYFSPPKPNIEFALEILQKYSNEIDSYKALNFLPPVITVSAVKDFLQCVLHTVQSQKYSVQLAKSLQYSEHLQVQTQRIKCYSHKLTVTDLDMCRVCQKRIGKSAFAHFPTGVKVHYSCKDQYSTEM